METIKKNLLSLVAGLVAVIAIVISFFPMQGWFTELNQELQQRKQEEASIAQLSRSEHVMPIVSAEQTQAEKLDRFPNEETIKWGVQACNTVAQQAKDILATAIEINMAKDQRQLLATDPVIFRDRYDALVRGFPSSTAGGGIYGAAAAAAAAPTTRPSEPGKLLQQLRATTPPTKEEIDQVIKQKMERETADMARTGGAGQDSAKMQELQNKLAEIPAQMQDERARDFWMYSTEQPLTYHPGLRDAQMKLAQPTTKDMWFAQVGLWIQQDVVQAIYDTNVAAKTTCVQNAPIKRLVEVRVPFEYVTVSGMVGSGPETGGGVAAPTGAFAGMPGMPGGAMGPTAVADNPAKRFTYSPTGRVGGFSGALYDTVHFTVTVDVDARYMETFLSELTRNRLISIIQVPSIVAIDKGKELEAGYVFGDAPLVRLEIKCEALFLRDSPMTKLWMPKSIKSLLNVDQADASGTTP